MFPIRKCFVLASVLALFATPLFAKDYLDYRWPTTNVTATRYQSPIEEESHTLTVLPEMMLKNSGVTVLTEALSHISSVQSVDVAGVKSLFMRGLASNQYQFLYDGVSMYNPTSPQGTPLFDTLLIENLDRIEVVEGALSDVYGSSGMGGVVQLFPKENQNTFDIRFSNYSTGISTQLNQKIANTRLHLGYAYKTRSGTSALRNTTEHDPRDSTNFRIKLQRDLGFGEGTFSYFKSLSNSHLDESFDPSKSPLVQDDPNYSNRIDQDLTQFSVKMPLSDRLSNTISYQISALYQAASNATDNQHTQSSSETYNRGRSDQLDALWRLQATPSWVAAWGLSLYKEHNETGVASQSSFGPYNSFPGPSSQTRMGVHTKHFLTTPYGKYYTGLRTDYYSATSGSELFKEAHSYSLGVVLNDPLLNLDWKGNLSTGYRAPSLYEKSNFIGTSKIEEAYLKDVSVEKKWGNFGFGITVFQSNVTNKIDYRQLSIDPYIAGYTNLSGVSQSDGITYRIYSDQFLFLDYMSIGYTQQRAIKSNNTPYARVPERKLSALFGTHFDNLKIGGSLLYLSERFDDVFVGFDETPTSFPMRSYILANLSFSYPFGENFTGYVTIQNLLNDRYEEAFGYPTLERHVNYGLSYEF